MTKVVIWGKEYPVPEKYTLGEAADIERICDGAPDQAKLRAMLATVWIAVQRVDPTATFEQIRALDFDEIEWVKDDPEAVGASSPETAGSQGSSESMASVRGSSTVSTPTSGMRSVTISGG